MLNYSLVLSQVLPFFRTMNYQVQGAYFCNQSNFTRKDSGNQNVYVAEMLLLWRT